MTDFLNSCNSDIVSVNICSIVLACWNIARVLWSFDELSVVLFVFIVMSLFQSVQDFRVVVFL